MNTLQRLFKTATVRDTLISFTGLGTTTAIGFVSTIILARVLGPEKFGVFSAVIALTTIVYSLGDLGIPPALINFLPKLPQKKDIIISTALIAQIGICLLSVFVFLGLALFHNAIIPGSLPEHIFLALLVTLIYILTNFAQGLFTARRQFWKYSAIQMIDSSIKIILILLLLVASRLDISTALLANAVSSFLALIITFGKETVLLEYRFDKAVFGQILSFSKWIAASRVFSVFFGRVDILLLNILVSSYGAGIFAAASRITLLFTLLISSLSAVISPRYSGFTTAGEIISYSRKLLFFVFGIATLMLLTIIFARPIILIVFGAQYLEAVVVFRLLAAAMLPFLFSLITTPAIIYTFNRPDFYAKVTALQVSLIVILDLLLINRFGLLAPVLAIGIANLIALALSAVKFTQLLKT